MKAISKALDANGQPDVVSGTGRATAPADVAASHSPLPWRHGHHRTSLGPTIGLAHHIVDANGVEVNLAEHVEYSSGINGPDVQHVFPLYTGAEDADFPVQPNNSFVLRACNSHYDLLAALKGYEAQHRPARSLGGRCDCANCNVARAAIAKAEGR